jgi:hypothetical protein
VKGPPEWIISGFKDEFGGQMMRVRRILKFITNPMTGLVAFTVPIRNCHSVD